MRVYRIPFSTNVERVALAAGHKGVEIEWVDVDAADRSPVEALSGQSLVPVLVDGAEIVADSPVIRERRNTPLFPSASHWKRTRSMKSRYVFSVTR